MESEKRMLMCRLTDDEHIDRGREQAEMYKAYCRVEAEKKAANEDLNHNVKRCVRQDTGEVVEEQTIPTTERQTQLLS